MSNLEFEIQDNIGFLTFDQQDSKVNLLSSENLKELSKLLIEVKGYKKLKCLVIQSAKKDVFIAGADIKEIGDIVEFEDAKSKAKAGQDVMNKIEDLKIPTIALIDGLALGGGCELALACDYRLATFNPKIKIGLPEVNLGILPGFGGTYRLPRLVGLTESLKIILAGRVIPAEKALKIRLFDRLIPQVNLENSLQDFIEDVLKKKIRRKKANQSGLDGSIFGQYFVAFQSKKNILKQTKGFYPAPLKALEVIKQNFYLARKKGMAVEAEGFAELAITDISKNLINVFYISEKYRKLTLEGVERADISNIKSCGVIGAGVMGGGIAQLLSANDYWVRLKDLNFEAIGQALNVAQSIFKKATQRRKMTKAEAVKKFGKITYGVDDTGMKNWDLVIEAVVENMDVKKNVFAELSEKTKADAILATNTSALSVTEMVESTNDPSRVVGIHFFNPVHRMPLVEIIKTKHTSNETLSKTLEFVKGLKKTPIIANDSCGFVVNRILLAYINEAGYLLEETGELEKIDQIMTDFGMPMGPFLLSDEVGLDVGYKVLKILEDAFGERFKPASVFEKIYTDGYLGKKSGKGFYIHGKKLERNPKIQPYLPQVDGNELDTNHAFDRMLYVMINEAAGCLAEDVVDDPAAIDVGMIFGTGFPAFRGGLLRYADSIGLEKIVAGMEHMVQFTGENRFEPCQYLKDLLKKKQNFY